MFAPANTAHFTLTIPRLGHDFKVLAFQGTEAISQPYSFELDLVSERPDLDIEGLLHQPAFLSYAGPDQGVHGLIHSVAQGESGKRLTRYRITLVPRLGYLQHATNQRIFQHRTVPQIITEVLKGHGIFTDSFRFQLREEGPERIYCTQYNETDLHFIQRLCEEEGIHYHFQHSPEGHQLVFGEDQTVFPKLTPTRFNQGSGMVADEPVIKRFNLRLQTRPSHVSRRDYNFEKPRLLMESKAQSEALPTLEDYDYPGHFQDRNRGQRLATRQLEAHRSDYRLAQGYSDQPLLTSGHFLALTEHPRADWNDLWLLTSVKHEGKQPQVLEESITDSDLTLLHAPTPSPLAGQAKRRTAEGWPEGRALEGRVMGWGEGEPTDTFTQGYKNTFTATPWNIIHRPQPQHPKQPVEGTQTAVVTGPDNEEIHCDEHGRVKVQFHWDRQGQANDKTSCWLRVASNWAGNRYGGIAIPRVGMEVLVTFLEGDPDQPLITGCLYHKTHQVPYPLPEHKTRSVFKTLSTPGGDGFNELRIDDKAGEEQIFIHAQRDWDQNIQHDQHIRVGHERHDHVEANSYTELLAEEHHTTHADRKTEIKADDHLTVANNQHIKLGAAHLLAAGREIHLKSGQKMVIEAGMEITLKAGGSFIKIDPSGVTLIGPQVRMNSGGSPGKGAGLGIKLPGMTSAADSDKQGNLLQLAGGNEEGDSRWLQVPKGQLTFDVEGNDKEGSIHFSRVAHWPPVGASGVTIGRGYDIGHQPNVRGDLESVGIADPFLSWLSGGAGLKGDEARDYLNSASPEIRAQQITRKQQHDLFVFVYDYMENDVKRICNKNDVVEAYGSTDWDTLHPKIKEILVDLRYRGDYTPALRTHIQSYVANNDLENFKQVIMDRSIWPANLPNDRFLKRSDFLGK